MAGALERAGGRTYAIAAYPAAELRAMAEGLAFPLLGDPERAAIRAFGVLHAGGGIEGEDIALPAHFLIRSDGTIAWRYVSPRINARPTPDAIEHAIGEL